MSEVQMREIKLSVYNYDTDEVFKLSLPEFIEWFNTWDDIYGVEVLNKEV